MLQKAPKPQTWKLIKKGAKILFVVELFAFTGSYGVWYCMNTDSDFRKYMSDSFPSVLNGFYYFGEKFGQSRIRHIDQAVWAAANKKTEQPADTSR